MPVELKVPEVGESIKEVLIGDWLKSEGEHVDRDEDVVVIETDKATVELAAPQSGTLTKVLKRTGDKAAVGDVIGYLEAGESNIKQPEKKEPGQTPALGRQETPRTEAEQKHETESGQAARESQPAKDLDEAPAQKDEAGNTREAQAESQTIASKSFPTSDNGGQEEREQTRSTEPRSSEEKIVNQKALQASKTLAARSGAPAASPNQASADELGAGEASESDKQDLALQRARGREEKIVPMTPIRRRIAEHLVLGQQTTAFLTTFNEIDISMVKSLREDNQEIFRAKHQIKLGYMSFFVKAAIEALKLVPQVNAEIRGTNLVFRNYYDVGVAVGGGKGLVVPVLRSAEQMSFAEIEKTIADFAQRAEKNRLKPQELEGGTFTISNGGIYGSLLSTPILNFPQSGILGLHAIQDRPVVRNGEVVVRPMMYVALTYDHRIVDGREAVTFLKHIKECIESPFRLLLEV